MYYLCIQLKENKMTNFKRIGNWYQVEVKGKLYNVIIQKDHKKITCDVSSIVILDEDLEPINTDAYYGEYTEIQNIFEKVDWKYDMVDE
jgi:hypothetical protein